MPTPKKTLLRAKEQQGQTLNNLKTIPPVYSIWWEHLRNYSKLMNSEWDDRSQNKRAKQWLAITVVVKHRPAIAHSYS